jgi:hypothetical protein
MQVHSVHNPPLRIPTTQLKGLYWQGMSKYMSDPSDFLQQKVFQGPCPECKAKVVVTVEDMIDQNDDPSYCENGPIECNSCGCSWFLTKLCEGSPRLVDYREHKHSVDGGPELGECLGNGNYCHCPECGIPFNRGIYETFSGYPCPQCGWPDRRSADSDDE